MEVNHLIDSVGEYGRMCMFVLETADVIPLTVRLVSTRQVSESRKCVHSNLHTHCLMLPESFQSCHLGKGLEKSIPVAMLLSASGLEIAFFFFFFFFYKNSLPNRPPSDPIGLFEQKPESPQNQHALQVVLRLFLFIHMGKCALTSIV